MTAVLAQEVALANGLTLPEAAMLVQAGFGR